jgi:hypothetical protein
VDFKNLLKELYNIKFSKGIKETIKDKKVLGWFFGGMFVYGLPAFYRYVTKNIMIPYMPLIETPSITDFHKSLFFGIMIFYTLSF